MRSLTSPDHYRVKRWRRFTFPAILAMALVSFTALPASPAGAGKGTSAGARTELPREFIGTWRLESEVLVDQSGAAVGSLYDDAIGKLTYTSRGDVWALVGERAPSESSDALWYTGTAKVHEKAGFVVHHVEYASIISWIGTDLRREVEFFAGGKGLRLSAEVTDELTGVLEWRKSGSGPSA